MVSLGEKIKQLRLDKNITQKFIADYLGIALYSVQRFEYGQAKPSYENLVKLADYFDVSVDYLLGRTNNPKVNE